MSACFLSPLDCTLVDEDAGTWRLDSPLVFHSELVGRIIVPAGFTSDFASVPRVPVVYLLYANRGRKAAVVHDYLYTYQVFDRATCDAIFREAMRAAGEGMAVAWAMWLGVRIYGSSRYNLEV